MNNIYIVGDLIQFSAIMAIQKETSQSENLWKQSVHKNKIPRRRLQSNACGDLLDSFLKITDILEQKLIERLKNIDAIHFKPEGDFDLCKQPILKKYIKYLSNDIGISELYSIQENGFHIRKLRGHEKIKLFERINIEHLYPMDIFEERKKINMVILIYLFIIIV